MNLDLVKKALTQVVDENNNFLIDSCAAMPMHQFTPEFDLKIKKLNRYATTNYTLFFKWQLRRTVVLLILAALLIIMATSTIAIIKVKKLSLKENFPDHVDFKSAISQSQKDYADFQFKYCYPSKPFGYVIKIDQCNQLQHVVQYENKHGESIFFVQNTCNCRTSLDNERHTISETEVKGYSAIAAKSKKHNMILFYTEEYSFFISGDCSYNLIYKMAESLVD